MIRMVLYMFTTHVCYDSQRLTVQRTVTVQAIGMNWSEHRTREIFHWKTSHWKCIDIRADFIDIQNIVGLKNVHLNVLSNTEIEAF